MPTGGALEAPCQERSFWTDGIVPYEFDANVSEGQRAAMIGAMREWEAVANVDFITRTSEANYLHIQDAGLNSCPVGMQGGRQDVNIHNWGWRFLMVHELGHALGFWDEHARPDRDRYVTINTGCIAPAKAHTFDIQPCAGQYGRYDFDSVMHYGGRANLNTGVPTCTATMAVRPPNEASLTRIAQKADLSEMDKLTMSFIYPEDDWRFVDGYYSGTETGSFLEPYSRFTTAEAATPEGGVLWIQPGTYSAVGTYDKAVTLEAALGDVRLGG
jgi:hypothetical protein